MTKQLQFRRYANTALANLTGLEGELMVDLTNKTLTVHDGITSGGSRLATESFVQGLTSTSSYGNSNVAGYLPVYGGVINVSTILVGGNTTDTPRVTFAKNQAITGDVYDPNLSNVSLITVSANSLNDINGFEAQEGPYAQVQIYTDGNIYFYTATSGSAPYWTMNKYGEFVLPNSSKITDVPDGAYANGLIITVNSNQTKFDTGGRTHFPNDLVINYGGITFPDTTYQYSAFTGYATDNTARTLSQSAYNQANAAFTQANNSGSGIANAAFIQANAAFAQANISVGVDSTQNTNIQLAWNTANAAFAQANTDALLSYANIIFTQANAAFVEANIAATIIPQNAQSTNYVLANTDAGKHLYYTNGSVVNLYLPWTSNTTFANGTTITIISHTSSNVSITPNTGVSMYLAGNTTSASRNVTTYGMATLIMTAANTWYINGTGVV